MQAAGGPGAGEYAFDELARLEKPEEPQEAEGSEEGRRHDVAGGHKVDEVRRDGEQVHQRIEGDRPLEPAVQAFVAVCGVGPDGVEPYEVLHCEDAHREGLEEAIPRLPVRVVVVASDGVQDREDDVDHHAEEDEGL